MYVVGIMTDLEYSLRAVAKASNAGLFAKTTALRAADRKQALWAIQRKLDHPLIQPALDVVATLELKLGNSEAIEAAAVKIGEAAYVFADQANGEELAAIDELLPPQAEYK
jgi:hypothetical protein